MVSIDSVIGKERVESNSSVVVFKEDFRRAAGRPREGDSPLGIHPDGEPLPHLVKTIGGRLIQIFDTGGGMKIGEAAGGLSGQLNGNFSYLLFLEKGFGRGVSETLNHVKSATPFCFPSIAY